MKLCTRFHSKQDIFVRNPFILKQIDWLFYSVITETVRRTVHHVKVNFLVFHMIIILLGVERGIQCNKFQLTTHVAYGLLYIAHPIFLCWQKYGAVVNLCPFPLFQTNSENSWDASMKNSVENFSLFKRSNSLDK